MPDGAITECQESHRTANTGQGDGPDNHKYWSKGLMGAVCRHDIPLFVCNIWTPGEQQHYPITLITTLFKELPPNATVGLLYNIGCMLDLSISKVCFQSIPIIWMYISYSQNNLIPDYVSRLAIAVSVFHMYGHQFCCQVVFHPWKHQGFRKSNGEGNE